MAEQGMLPEFFVKRSHYGTAVVRILFSASVLALSTRKVMVVSLIDGAIGLLMQPCLRHMEKKRWLKFSTSPDLPALDITSLENVSLVD
ncbi:hypothetical protein QQ045_018209 [Rhodiola kirilowii]